MFRLSLLLFSCYILASAHAVAQESPLQVVMDGREAAEGSNLTEAGMTRLAQSTANVILYVCGALAILLTMAALLDLYRASESDSMFGGQQATKEGAIKKLIIAGLVSIPAIIAAIIPYAVLPEAG